MANKIPKVSADYNWYNDVSLRLIRIEAAVKAVLDKLTIKGIEVIPGTPDERIDAMTVKTVKKSVQNIPTGKTAKAKKAIGDFLIVDNEDSTCTVQGVDASGAPVDISGLATLVVSSSDPLPISVDTPSRMTFGMHALKPSVPGTPVQITATVTFTAGGIGPFTAVLPCDVNAGPATGLIIVPGTPAIR